MKRHLFSDSSNSNNNCFINLVVIVLHKITYQYNSYSCCCRERGARALEERLAAERLAAAAARTAGESRRDGVENV